MLSREFYNVVHILGIILLMSSLGGVALHAMNGGTSANNRSRRFTATLHGLGAACILVGGFGMLARWLMLGLPALGGVAAFMGIYKPV